MKQFIMLYNGPATPMEQMTEDQGKKTLMGWQTWMERIGSALIDIGAPMANGRAVVDDGSQSGATDLNGYSIVQAESMDEALKLVDGHPFLSDRTGKFRVDVFELLPVPL